MVISGTTTAAFDDGQVSDNLRVLPIITYGAASNLDDLLYLRHVDLVMTQSDIFRIFPHATDVLRDQIPYRSGRTGARLGSNSPFSEAYVGVCVTLNSRSVGVENARMPKPVPAAEPNAPLPFVNSIPRFGS
jgi:hypothetical protein